MIGEIVKLVFGLVPGEDATAAEQKMWRKTVGLTVGGLVCMVGALTLMVAIIYGIINTSMVDRFARSRDVQSVSQQLSVQLGALGAQVQRQSDETSRHYISQLQNSLLDVLSKDCKSNNPELRDVYGRQLNDMMSDYERLTGKVYVLLPCDKL